MTEEKTEIPVGVELEYVANSGVLIKGAGKKILFDGIHTIQRPPFSPVPKDLLIKILDGEEEFEDIDWLIFSHRHIDHCDPRLLARFRNKKTHILIPAPDGWTPPGNIANPMDLLPDKPEAPFVFRDGPLTITACRTTHDWPKDFETEHYSYLVDVDGFRFLLMGDAETGNGRIDSWIAPERVNVVCVNFVELNQAKGRKFLCEAVQPDHVLLYHLPLPPDDRFHNQKLTRRAMEKYGAEMPPMHICETAQQRFIFRGNELEVISPEQGNE